MRCCTAALRDAQASNSTGKLDEHLEGLKGDPKSRPTAAELLESLAELAQGTQAARAALMLSLAARVVVKSDLALEDVEARIPQGLQLSLLLHVRKEVQQLDPATRAEWECHVQRWVLRTVVRGDDTRGKLPGGPPDEDAWDPKEAARHLGELLAQHSEVSSPHAAQKGSGVSPDLPLLCATSHDLAEWHLHRGELQRAEELFRMSLAIIHRLNLPATENSSKQISKAGRRCIVRPERLSALALALRMLRLSQPNAPPTPQIKRDSKQNFIGDDSAATAGGELPMSSSAVLLLAAEQLRLAGYSQQLIQLLHLDNVLRLATWMPQQDKSAANGAEAPPTAKVHTLPAVVPLPWSYRENLCLWMSESGEPAAREGLSKRVAAVNSVVTLASAPAVPAVVCLKMLRGPLDSGDELACASGVGAKRARLVANRLSNSSLALEAVEETVKMMERAQDAGLRSSLVHEVFPDHLAQAGVLVPMLKQGLAEAAESSGVLSAAQDEMRKALRALQSAARAARGGTLMALDADGSTVAEEAPREPPLQPSKKSKSCRPSDLAAFLRSAGNREDGAAGGKGDSWMEHLRPLACVSGETVDSWFRVAPAPDGAEGGQRMARGEKLAPDGWAGVKECCARLRASAAHWASVVQINDEAGEEWGGDAKDEEAEAFESAERDLDAVVRAGVRAGGKEMTACAFPLRSWFGALSEVAPRDLEAMADLARCYHSPDASSGSESAAPSDAAAPAGGARLRARPLSDGHVAFFRAVVALLQEHNVRNVKWAVEGGRLALLDGHAPAAIRCLATSAIHLLGTHKEGGGAAVSGGERRRERGDGWGSGGGCKQLRLPPALADLLVTCLCKVQRHVDAILVAQMMMPAQLDRHLPLLVEHCSCLDAHRACWLWNLDVCRPLPSHTALLALSPARSPSLPSHTALPAPFRASSPSLPSRTALFFSRARSRRARPRRS